MPSDITNRAGKLLHILHSCPELSGHEEETKAVLKSFFAEQPAFELHECGNGFYAALRAPGPKQGGIALRADYDALPLAGGGAAHLCGHDGHSAALYGAALRALQMPERNRDLFFLFQPSEETGEGALGCLELFEKENIAEIYGAHNLPGLPLGQVYTRNDTFACASRGLIITLTGKPSHAAYPEHGVSPSPVLGKLLCDLPAFANSSRFEGITLCTVIGAHMGEKAFGSSAAKAELWLTLRAERDEDLALLQSSILSAAEAGAKQAGLAFEYSITDPFAATVNHTIPVRNVLNLCGGKLLEQPMRWSEDFGLYLQKRPGAFFGIGAGENCPALHTENYVYPDDLLEPAIEAFANLIKGLVTAL